MGGKALKKTYTRRCDREEFNKLSEELIKVIEKTYSRACIPLFYADKKTFGDIDIIVEVKDVKDVESVREFININLTPNEIFRNGNCISFDYKEIQVDFILCEEKNYESYFHYYSYNDLGNLMGRLSHSLGLKYGQDGLFYNHYSDSNTKDKIMISQDHEKIFDLLGLDYEVWKVGFDSLEDVFEYILTSALFNPEMYQLENLNKVNRERNLKRKSYMSFLNFIKDKKPNPNYYRDRFSLLREKVIDVIINVFPEANIEIKLAEIEYRLSKKKLMKLKFNGALIKEMYGLEGKEIGDAIKIFKEYISVVYYEMEFDDFIVNYSMDYIFGLFEQSMENK